MHHWVDFLEATSGFALYPNKRDEWDSINAEIDRRGITYEQIEARKKELGLEKLVKCKDCKNFSACQIRVSTENPNVEIECSEYMRACIDSLSHSLRDTYHIPNIVVGIPIKQNNKQKG